MKSRSQKLKEKRWKSLWNEFSAKKGRGTESSLRAEKEWKKVPLWFRKKYELKELFLTLKGENNEHWYR